MSLDYVLTKAVETSKQPALAFASKSPNKTRCLCVAFLSAAQPVDLLCDLAAIGWVPGPFQCAPTPWNGIQKLDLGKDGTGLFKDWTEAEGKLFLRQVRAVLKKHGYVGVPHYKLTLADCL